MINKVKVFKALKGTLNPTRVGHKVLWKSIDPETIPLKVSPLEISGSDSEVPKDGLFELSSKSNKIVSRKHFHGSGPNQKQCLIEILRLLYKNQFRMIPAPRTTITQPQSLKSSSMF